MKVHLIDRHLGWLPILGLGLGLCFFVLTASQHAAAAQSWQQEIVVNADTLGLYSALVLDAQGYPVISYYDSENLTLVHCGDAFCQNNNVLNIVDNDGNEGLQSALVLDRDGRPVISYLDANNFALKLAYCGDAHCASANVIQTIDNSSLVGLSTALTLDSAGNPVISYTNFGADQLLLAHCRDPYCSTAISIQVVDSVGGVGQFITLALDRNGLPVIAYRDVNSRQLKVARCGDADCRSGNQIRVVDNSGNTSSQVALALTADDKPRLSYFDERAGALKLLVCGNSTCSAGNQTRTLDRGNLAVAHSALALDQSGLPIISYVDQLAGAVKVVECSNPACSVNGTPQVVDQGAAFSWVTALALDQENNPVISYIDTGAGALKVARRQGVADTLTCFDYLITRGSDGAYTAPGWQGNLIVGTDGKDNLKGTKQADLILGLGGNDVIAGRGGDDVICGGPGNDRIIGAAANDQIDGGPDQDRINSGAGFYDIVLGGPGDDILSDPDGVLRMEGGPGTDKLSLVIDKNWLDQANQRFFNGLAAGYDNDRVNLLISGRTPLTLDITGDERDEPASPLEGTADRLKSKGPLGPTSTIIKFEVQQGVTLPATPDEVSEQQAFIQAWLADGEWVSEGEESLAEDIQRVFLPVITR